MRKLIIIPLLLLSIILNATTYYVAPASATPAGSDTNAGTIAAPWGTLDKAFDNATAGDTVYFRGGIYYPASESQLAIVANNGTEADPIVYMNYPDETPIFDCRNVTSDSYTYAIRGYNRGNLKIKGLTIRNLIQAHTSDVVQAMYFEIGTNITIENCVVYNISGVGIGVYGFNSAIIKNCDAYNLCDSLQSPYPGQNGVGFGISTRRDYGAAMYDATSLVEGCRAWNCSDQGFASGGVGTMEWTNCWSWNNGLFYGDGIGFKYSISTRGDTINPLSTYIHNCIAADNGMTGFTPNNLNGTVFNGHYYNNFAYHNGYKPDLENYNATFGYGFFILNYSDPFVAPHEMFSNNISYDNQRGAIYVGDVYTHEYNSWDLTVTVTDDDFISLDTAELRYPRQSDWSLPDIDFGKLVATSDLIDAGIDVGIDYNGIAPDLGYAEYGDDEPNDATDITAFTLAAQTGAATINTTTHTVAIEVAYGTTVTALSPTISVSYGASIDPPGGTARNFSSPVTYTVTAEDGVTEQEWTVTVTVDSAPATSGTVVVGDDWVVLNGQIVKI